MGVSVFVDMVKVSQYHGERCPELVGGLTFKYDDDGDLVTETGHNKALRGSFSTALQVKSHGGRVTVRGNPSRFNRPDNLFGYDIDECLTIINVELGKLGLPAFTAGEELPTTVSSIDGWHGLPDWSGATISELHLTENYSAGSDLLARLAIKAYQSRAVAYMRKAVYGEETAYFHNTHRTVKAYRKGPDMAVHCKESPWREWALEQGIVRHEVELHYRYLQKTGLRFWGNCTMARLYRLFEKESAALGRPELSFEPLDIDTLPPQCRVPYAAWLKGEDLRALLPRATFYRYRKLLRERGVDIAEVRPFGQAIPIVRVVELAPARAPVGYWQEAA